MDATVTAVSFSPRYDFSKSVAFEVHLRAGLGIDGDVHQGETVRHRSRMRHDPTLPNLRQVHLIHEELHDELRAAGFGVGPGVMGENITTRGIDLLGLPTGTRLQLGADAVIELTGLRNPCKQLDDYHQGLMAAVLERRTDGTLVRKAGVMAIVLRDGVVRAGDTIRVELPAGPARPLVPV
ncbi:MAG: MOSC domain-containing protein [Gammaproteobacteria bacterium]